MTSLTQFQLDAITKGIMRRTSQLLVTMDFDEGYEISEIAILNRVASDFKARAIVVCPNPHQAEKRFQSLSHKCRRLGIEAVEIIRRRTAINRDVRTGRVIVATFSSLSIALMTHPEILENLECILIDRLDLIGQPELGAKLETVLVSLMGLETEIQYIAISPPVADIEDLESWLDMRVVEDPKPEVKRIYSVKAFGVASESLSTLSNFVVKGKGQIMVLCANRTATEELALQLAGTGEKGRAYSLDLDLSSERKQALNQLSDEVNQRYPDCAMTVELNAMIPKGVSFFHEGVARSQRRRISKAWEEGNLPVIVMPTRFAIASGLRATVVFLMGVFMQEAGKEHTTDESLILLSEWQLSDVLQAAGRAGIDKEGFGIVVVDNETERQRVLAKYFQTENDGSIHPCLGEVDSTMDDPENAQDLVLRQICTGTREVEDPFSVIDRTFWAAANRTTRITYEELLATDNASVEALVSIRATKTTVDRAREIPDKAVRLVSVNPSKIEGLIRSSSRDLWHLVIMRAGEGMSCTCESWKFQGIRRHRLCKHLVRFASFALSDAETKPYARSVIIQALRGLEILGDLEREGLVLREKGTTTCTGLGENVVVLGVPVKDAKAVRRALAKQEGNLKQILLGVTAVRTGLPKKLIRSVLDLVLKEGIEDIIRKTKGQPGIVENILEELQYANSILLKLMAGTDRKGLNRESFELDKKLLELLSGIG